LQAANFGFLSSCFSLLILFACALRQENHFDTDPGTMTHGLCAPFAELDVRAITVVRQHHAKQGLENASQVSLANRATFRVRAQHPLFQNSSLPSSGTQEWLAIRAAAQQVQSGRTLARPDIELVHAAPHEITWSVGPYQHRARIQKISIVPARKEASSWAAPSKANVNAPPKRISITIRSGQNVFQAGWPLTMVGPSR